MQGSSGNTHITIANIEQDGLGDLPEDDGDGEWEDEIEEDGELGDA